MDVDVAQTAAAVMPYVTAVAGAYGARTLEKLRDEALDQASDATVGLGRRILNRILGRDESRGAIEEALTEAVDAPEDEDTAAALRLQIRKAFKADPSLAAEVAEMLQSGSTGGVTADGHGMAVGGNAHIQASHGAVAAGVIHGGVSTSGNPSQPGAGQA
ncbi:hypothetical protein ACQPZX_38430 [Actinoplanes sp. CA-142083]|uniref:hypothetical protein n=1 Tax=Actinoplanes sp. CA-142083 TaxID=3239903 RepID=UPI003D90BA0B